MYNKIKDAVMKAAPKIWGTLLMTAFLLITAAELSAQDYQFTINQRRMGDTIGVEIWVKSLTATAPNLGNMSIPVLYNHNFLQPAALATGANPNPRDYTDSISYDMELTDPRIEIESPFTDNTYNYTDLSAQAVTASNGTTTLYAFVLDVNTNSATPTGYQPASTGRGTFVGMLKFYITNDTLLYDAALTEVDFNDAAWLAVSAITDISGNDITSTCTFTDPGSFTIRGLSILNPNFGGQAVNRNPDEAYPILDPNLGYPIYFERSGLSRYGTAYGNDTLGYYFQYSLDNGSTWNAIGSVAEQTSNVSSNASYYVDGDIDTKTSGTPRYITQYNNDLLLSGFGGVLRVIWKADNEFPYRSEQGRLRVRQIEMTGTGAAISARDPYSLDSTSRWDINDASFVLGRLFFVQLNGTSQYLKSARTFSNATLLTVEAWVNLNSIQTTQGAEPAVVASAAGEISPQEGAWMLYLSEGRYPAFRAREIEGRGPGGYIGTVIAEDALTTTSDASPITDVHSRNWVHLAGVVDNNVVKLYVNGEEVGRYTNEQAVNIRMLTSNHPVWVGVNPNGGIDAQDYLHAGIKEVKVWRTALSQDQIREHAAGVYDPTDIADLTDERVKLELYYPLQGVRTDRAYETYYQNDYTVLNHFVAQNVDAEPQNSTINFRPDMPHIRLTSPTGDEGVSNLKDETFEVRWIGYGIGSTAAGSEDILIQVSRDNGATWFDAIDNSVPSMPLDVVEIEDGAATWEPYNNSTITDQSDDLQGIIDIDGNYSKNVLLKISGIDSQEVISDTSGSFVVAPYFGFRNTTNTIVRIPENNDLNMSNNGVFMLEAWIRPFRFPTNDEGYFPIISKKADDGSNNLHYALRLLPTGQLQLALASSTGLTTRTATSSSHSDSLVTIPNVIENDTAWTHVAVFVNPNNGGESTVLFYIDGAPQKGAALTDQLGTEITVNNDNTYPAFIGYEPGLTTGDAKSFIGDLREIRFWNGYPGNQEDGSNNDVSNLTYFIQGALSVRADELGTFSGNNYAENLVAAYSMNGGAYVNNGMIKSIPVYPVNENLNAKVTGSGFSYQATKPYLKVTTPTYKQKVANTATNLKVRWVGFDYNRNNLTSFVNGSNGTDHASLEYSVEGGGGELIQPYQFVASQTYNPGFTDALTLPTSNAAYEFPGTTNKSQFSGYLNVSITDPDVTGDSSFTEQGPIAAANSNARLRLNGLSTINGYDVLYLNGTNGADGYMDNLRPESKLFSITPQSNFTVRVLLEGYHEGSTDGIQENLGTTGASDNGAGLTIELFENVANNPGNLVTSQVSENAYLNETTAFDPANRNDGTNNNFANVPFVFDTIQDGRYFVKVNHINHLSVMSRYAAPFYFSGDDRNTWAIESGWDFQMWDGDTTDAISSENAATNPPTMGNSYSAYGQIARSRSNVASYAVTSLIYNDGRDGITTSAQLAAMVGGDVTNDGAINALDRARVVADNGTSNVRSQVKGGSAVVDGTVNGTDRQIVYRNNGKEEDPQLPVPAVAPIAIPGEISMIDVDNTMDNLLNMFVEAEKGYVKVRNTKNETIEPKLQAGGVSYEVNAYPAVNGEFIEIPMYAKNTGGDFGLGNCTFGITFETTKLEFVEMVQSQKVIFHNDNNLGYFPAFSSPVKGTKNSVVNLRTIDINFDNYPLANKPGLYLPTSPTYLGTLRFRILDNARSFNFNWHPATVVYTVDGREVTGDGTFNPIKPVNLDQPIAVIFPNGGESLIAGRPYTITWTSSAISKLAFIDFSKDNGTTWERVTKNSVDLMSGSFNWNSPRVNSTKCLIALIDATNGNMIDRSDNVFTLSSAPAVITRPGCNDAVYRGGSSDFIRWEIEENTQVKFEFSENGVSNWKQVTPVIQSNKLEQNWVLPAVNTKNAVVRMVNAQTGEIIAVSCPFKILAGSLTLTSPREGEKLKSGTKKPIRWNYDNVTTFDLHLSIDGGKNWLPIDGDVKAAPKTYDWIVYNANTKNAVIRAIYNGDPDLEYSRTGEFEISGAVDVDDPSMYGYSIESITPNPFTTETAIKFRLPQSENVTINVYDMNGQVVANLADGQLFNAGTNTIMLKGTNLSAGMYMLRINVGMFNLVKEIIHIK